MNAREVIDRIRAREPEIRRLGIRELSLFGSFARDKQTDRSDVDLLYAFEDGQTTLHNWLDLIDLLHDALDREVHLVARETLSRYLAPYVLAEARPVLQPSDSSPLLKASSGEEPGIKA